MTYTDFLKSHFGEDGSLARVLQEIKKTEGGYYNIVGFDSNDEGSTDIYAKNEITKYHYVCFNFIIDNDVYSQSHITQRKIAELLGWRECHHSYQGMIIEGKECIDSICQKCGERKE